MNCTQCRELLVADLEGILETGRAEMTAHLAECAACRAEAATLKTVRGRLVRLAESVKSSTTLKQPVMDRIAQLGHRNQEGKPMLFTLRRFFARPLPLTAASLAFLALAGGALFLIFGHGRYALAQTVEAHRAVRTVHVMIETGGMLVFGKDGTPEYPPESGATEMWAELDDAGKLVRSRMDMAFTFDGPKIVFWQDGKASVWFPSKNSYVTLPDSEGSGRFPKEFLNPNALVAALEQRVAEGKVKIVEAQPTDVYKKFGKSEWMPKVLVVNPAEPQGIVEVYVIDPKTKLLQQYEKYRKNETELVLLMRSRFGDYNLPIPADIFAPRLPTDVMKIDQTAMREIGLDKGQMTDAEVAKAVVRQFFEAAIAQDYDKASVLLGGIPVERLKASLSEQPIVEIISIGEAVRDPQFGGYDGLFVPYAVKLKDGTIKKWRAAVRPVYNQPHRWALDGGV